MKYQFKLSVFPFEASAEAEAFHKKLAELLVDASKNSDLTFEIVTEEYQPEWEHVSARPPEFWKKRSEEAEKRGWPTDFEDVDQKDINELRKHVEQEFGLGKRKFKVIAEIPSVENSDNSRPAIMDEQISTAQVLTEAFPEINNERKASLLRLENQE